MVCPNCKAESEGCAYCPNCGTPLTQQSYYQAPPQQRSYTAPEQNYYANQYQHGQQPNVTNNFYNMGIPISRKSRLAALLLCAFLGVIGVHRFYAGKIGTGLLYIFTGGLFGVGYIVDIILIACGTFKDSYGYPILQW